MAFKNTEIFHANPEKSGRFQCKSEKSESVFSVLLWLSLPGSIITTLDRPMPHQAFTPGEDRRLRAINQLQFAQNITDMAFNRFLTDDQSPGNFRIRQSLCYEAQDADARRMDVSVAGEADPLNPTGTRGIGEIGSGLHAGTSRDRIELPRNVIRVIEADVPAMALWIYLNPIVAYPCRV